MCWWVSVPTRSAAGRCGISTTLFSDDLVHWTRRKLLVDSAGPIPGRPAGINILYITFGMLKWKEKGESTFTTSPLLFIPAKLSMKPLAVDLLDDEVIVNPALREKLLGDRIRIPKFGHRLLFEIVFCVLLFPWHRQKIFEER